MIEDRRSTDCWDAALIMGLVYTVIYAGMMGGILLVNIPPDNKSTVDILAGAMTIIQTTIVTYFFGASKNSQDAQKLIAASKERTDSVLRDVVASAAPKVSADPILAQDVSVKAAGDVTVEKDKP